MTCVRMPEVGEVWKIRDREFRIVEQLPSTWRTAGKRSPLWRAEQIGPYIFKTPDGGTIMIPASTYSIYLDEVRSGRWAFVRAN